MVNHLLANVRWSVIGQWKRLLLKHTHRGSQVFVYGSNDDQQFKQSARDGAQLWIVSTPPGFPPTLVARLTDVQRIDASHDAGVCDDLLADLKEPGKGGSEYLFKVKGGRGSRFYGNNDASTALEHTTLLGQGGTLKAAGEEWVPRRHGVMLMRPKRLQDADALKALATDALHRAVFVSWKHCDKDGQRPDHVARRRAVRELVRELNRRGVAVWLDELALPNFKPHTTDDALMESLLRVGLHESRVVAAVASDCYGTRSPESDVNWTAMELQSKRRQNRVALFLGHEAPDGAESLLVGPTLGSDSVAVHLNGDPSQVASEFCRWYDQR